MSDKQIPASEAELEAEIQTKGLNAPRLTPDSIEATISSEFYFTGHEAAEGAFRLNGMEYQAIRHDDIAAETPLRCLTICVMVLRNGYTVVGTSACASPENFDRDIGRKVARENARREIWKLEGYLLRSRLLAGRAPSEG